MRFRERIAVLSACLALAGCGTEQNLDSNFKTVTSVADNGFQQPSQSVVLRWNKVALDATGLDHSAAGAKEQLGPTKASRAMAMVHLAMHDSLQRIEGRYETYLPATRTTGAISAEAAVSFAAHDTLVALYPSQRATFDGILSTELASLGRGAALSAGQTLGQDVALAILNDRSNDGSDNASQSTPAYVFGTAAGQWRRDPTNPGQQPLGPNWGKVRLFAVNNTGAVRSPAPPALGSAEYAAAYNEAKTLGGDGIVTPTTRTAEQTHIGVFWAYDGTPSLCAPPRLYNQISAQILFEQGIRNNGDLSRSLALVNLAMADAGICCWETKFFYNLWRPITGIRESDAGTGPSGSGDGNASTTGDLNFTPLGAPASNLNGPNFTPPFPAYPSGHATFGGTYNQVLRRVLGRDNVEFTFVSDEFNGVTKDNTGQVRPFRPRKFVSLSQAEKENADSRIYLGIHWRFDASEGIRMGNNIGNIVVDSKLRPISPAPNPKELLRQKIPGLQP